MAREARRTAAILDADAIGRSGGTVTAESAESEWTARLARHRVERLEPAVARHGGRVIRLTDHGMRAEFPSAAQALDAAIEFQQAMAAANRGQDADGTVVFRLGLQLVEAGARDDRPIERPPQRAAGGGIVVTAAMRDALAGQVEASFAELGSAGLGTVERPVHTYEVGWDPADWPIESAAAARPLSKPRSMGVRGWAAVLAAGLVVLGLFHLADAPRPPRSVVGGPQLGAAERSRLQESAAYAYALWQQQQAEQSDDSVDQPARADSAASAGAYDGLYAGTVTMRSDNRPVTATVRVTHGVGVGTQSRVDCGSAPLSLRISSSGDVSGLMLVFSSTCLRTELAIRGRAVAGTLQLRFGSQYLELEKRD